MSSHTSEYIPLVGTTIVSLILTIVIRQTRFSTFPDVLVIHARKFQLVDWVPQKLGQPPAIRVFPLSSSNRSVAIPDIPLRIAESNTISLDKYAGKGHQAGEELLPTEAEGTHT